MKDGVEGVTVRGEEWCPKKSGQGDFGAIRLWMTLTGQSFVDAVEILDRRSRAAFFFVQPLAGCAGGKAC